MCVARGGTEPTTSPGNLAPWVHAESDVWHTEQDIRYVACLEVEGGEMDEKREPDVARNSWSFVVDVIQVNHDGV